MGLIECCPECGSSPAGVALACRHVVAAVAAAAPRFEAEYRVYGDGDDSDLGLIYHLTVCRVCIHRLGLPPTGAFASRAVVDAACHEVDGVCSGCLQRWLAGATNA